MVPKIRFGPSKTRKEHAHASTRLPEHQGTHQTCYLQGFNAAVVPRWIKDLNSEPRRTGRSRRRIRIKDQGRLQIDFQKSVFDWTISSIFAVYVSQFWRTTHIGCCIREVVLAVLRACRHHRTLKSLWIILVMSSLGLWELMGDVRAFLACFTDSNPEFGRYVEKNISFWSIF